MKYKVFRLLAIIAVLTSCNVKRSVVSQSSEIRNDRSSTITVDSSKVNADKEINITENSSEKDNTYKVIAEFDSLGNITRLMYMLSVREILNNKTEFSTENFKWLSGLSVIDQSQNLTEQKESKNENFQQKNKTGGWIWFTVISVVVIALIFITIKFKLWR